MNREELAVLFGSVDHVLQKRARHGDRLFGNDVLACGKRLDDDIVVAIVRGCDGHNIDLFIRKKLL